MNQLAQILVNENIQTPLTVSGGTTSEKFASMPVINNSTPQVVSNYHLMPLSSILNSSTILSGASLSSVQNLVSMSELPSYNPLINSINSYIWEDVNNIIPVSRLEENLKYYETKYAMSSEELYSKWIEGKITPDQDKHDWLNLYLLLKP